MHGEAHVDPTGPEAGRQGGLQPRQGGAGDDLVREFRKRVGQRAIHVPHRGLVRREVHEAGRLGREPEAKVRRR